MPSRKISYSRGFPCGAPLVMLRGGALKQDDVKRWVRERGFRWNGRTHAYEHYMYGEEFREVLAFLQDTFGCEIKPKDNLDPNYIIDLTRQEN